MKNVRLSDVCSIRYGKDHKKLGSGNIPAYGSGGIMRYVDKAIHDRPSVLIPRKGSLNNLFFADEPFWTVDTLFWTEIDDDKVLPKYLFYVLGRKNLSSLNEGTAVPSLTTKTLSDITIALPSIEKQREIIEKIEPLESKIKNNTQINDNLYEIVDAFYKKLFTAGDLKVTTIGQYMERIYSGGTPSTSNPSYWNGAYNWFSSGETKNPFVVSTEKTITQVGIDNSSTKLANKYDVVIASAGQGFTRGQTSMLLLDTYINQSVIVLHGAKNIMPYVFWNLRQRYDELRAISDSSSIRGSLTTKTLSRLEIPEISDAEIIEFSKMAWPAINQIENNLNENKQLIALRDLMLSRLFKAPPLLQ